MPCALSVPAGALDTDTWLLPTTLLTPIECTQGCSITCANKNISIQPRSFKQIPHPAGKAAAEAIVTHTEERCKAALGQCPPIHSKKMGISKISLLPDGKHWF
jgi:hypothetical protein